MNNNKKATKRALLTSVMALVMCVVMLVGTTFAWFTDTASTAVNKIQAGNLDVALEMYDTVQSKWVSAEGKTLQFKKAADAPADEKVLWEPGCTYELPELRIVNKGNLALKYKISISGAKDATPENDKNDLKLLDVIDWTYSVSGVGGDATAELGTERHLAAKTIDTDVYDTLTIKGQMQKSAGNDYQGMAIEGIAITVVATQDTVESDSFSKDYDKNATYPVVVSQNELNTTLTLADLEDENGNISPVEVTLGNTAAEDINYRETNSGYTGKGVMLGSTKLNKYAAAPAAAGEYKFTFKDGTITSAATGYPNGEPGAANSAVYMLVPGNSDVVFENVTFKNVVSFGVQKYTSPWSRLNSITFKNCIFDGLIVGTCPAANVTFDGCKFNSYTNQEYANNSNPIWWRSDMEDLNAPGNRTPIKSFTFVNNTVVGTRPIKIERVGMWDSEPVFTFKNNTFDISAQTGDTETKNMAINIGQKDNACSFTLIDEGNTISGNTAALYTAARGSGSNQYFAVSGNKVLDGNGNAKVITAMVWKTTTGETFELKSVK